MALNEKSVLAELSKVLDPEIKKDLVTLNMVRDIKVDGTKVSLNLVLTTTACPLKAEIQNDVTNAVKKAGAETVEIETTAEVPQGKGLPDKKALPGIKNIIAVASGKGGVGKSTVATNLALALAKTGAAVGLMDSDVYGPSIPLMLGVHEKVRAAENGNMIPHEKYGVKMISIGFMLDEEKPVIWRGPMVMQLVTQFLTKVEWGELDYLVIDLPPGTGDAQLTLAQTVPVSASVIVTTPQDVALIDARRAIGMFNEVGIPVAGVIENMSYFSCPHCNERTDIFSHGGGEKTADKYGVEFLGEIPLDIRIRECGDAGEPIVSAEPDSPHTKSFMTVAEKVAAKISVLALTAEPVPEPAPAQTTGIQITQG